MNELIIYGGVYSLCLIFVILSILLVKKLMSPFLSSKGQYQLWLVLIAAAAVPFLPKQMVSVSVLRDSSFPQISGVPDPVQAAGNEAIRDLAVNSAGKIPNRMSLFLLALWLSGVLFFLIRLALSAYRTRHLRTQAFEVTDPYTRRIFQQCAKLLGCRRRVWLGYSDRIRTPVMFGSFRSCILLPLHCETEDLKYIFLHELTHCKRQDALFNLLMQFFVAFNWFNPAVWLAASRMNGDRESACDSTVLDLLIPSEKSDYGRALINWAAGGQSFTAVELNGSGKQLHSRIRKIACHRESTALRKRADKLIPAVMILTTLVMVPPASALTDRAYEPPAGLHINYENMGEYFGSSDGCFVLYDRSRDAYTIHGESASKTRFSPNSTFKIYSALSALESGAITPDRSMRKWDGKDYPFDEWEKDQTLSIALKNSVNWYFQELDQRAGRQELQTFYDRIHYGNCDLSGGISDYWMESTLKISPLEQVMLLSGVYENAWDFSADTIRAVKDALLLSTSESGTLSGKSGTGMIDGRTVNGWFIGYVEKSSDVYFFAANIRGDDGASGSRAEEIAKKILEDRGILPGP